MMMFARRPTMLTVAYCRSVSSKPQKRIKSYKLKAESEGVCTTATAAGFTMKSDLPIASGGGAKAPEPVYLLLSALAGCEAATAVFVARKLRIGWGRVEFVLSAVRDERGALALPINRDPEVPARLLRIWGTASVDTDATDEQLKLLERQVHLRCPVANLIRASGTELDVKWQKREPQ